MTRQRLEWLTTPLDAALRRFQASVAELDKGGFTSATGSKQNNPFISSECETDRLESLVKADLV
jgi:hypothetical protein